MIYNKKIKILFLIDSIETDRAGTESQLIKLIENINREEFECHLCCFEDTNWLKTNKLDVKKFIIGGTSLGKYNMYSGLVKFIMYLKENNIDIINAYFIKSITIGVITSKIAGVKFIISSRRDMGYWRTKYLMVLINIANRYVSKFLVNSNQIKKELSISENIKKNRIHVIYNGIEIQKMKNTLEKEIRDNLQIQDNYNIVGTIANLNRDVKRIDVFILCAKYVLDIDPMVKFIIVGEGHLKKKYIEQSKKLGIYDNIIFLGSIYNTQDYVTVFDVAINSSDSEGFSNAVIEYLAFGIPTVATDVGGNSEIISNMKNGILVPPGNPKIMAEAVLNLIKNRNLRNFISINAKISGGKYSLFSMVRRHEMFYKKLISKDYKGNSL